MTDWIVCEAKDTQCNTALNDPPINVDICHLTKTEVSCAMHCIYPDVIFADKKQKIHIEAEA